MRPFRFAVTATQARSADSWAAFARGAERLGFSALLMPDHLSRQYAPLPALAAAAATTTRLRLGALVFANDYRNPVMLAREIATLDVLSNGRVELGIGAGWNTSDYRQLGIRYDAPPVRVERLGEAIRLLKRLFTEDSVDFDGKHYRVRGARLWPKPVQRPHPPIHIGGGGPRMLALAAREADTVGILVQFDRRGRPRVTDLTAGATDRKIARVRAAAGARFDQLELGILVFDVEVAERAFALRTLAARLKGALASLVDTPYVLYGTPEEIKRDLIARRERYGISYYAVPGHAMRALAPIVRDLSGP